MGKLASLAWPACRSVPFDATAVASSEAHVVEAAAEAPAGMAPWLLGTGRRWQDRRSHHTL